MKNFLFFTDCLPVANMHSFEHNGEIWKDCINSRFLIERGYMGHLLLAVFAGVLSFSLSVFMTIFIFNAIAKFLADPTQPFWWGMVLTVIMLFVNLCQNFVFAFAWVQSCSLGLKLKSGYLYTCYNKAIKLKVIKLLLSFFFFFNFFRTGQKTVDLFWTC